MPKALEGVEWNKLQMLYMTGQATCRELSEKFGVSIQAIARRCTREGWRTEKERCVQKMSEKTIETVVDKRLKAIEEHEALVIPIAESLIHGVKKSYEWTHSTPSGAEPQQLQGLAMALKTANSVARLNLGCRDGEKLEVSGTVVHSHSHAIQVLESCKRIASEQPDCAKTIDLPALLEIVNRKDP